MRIPLDIPAGLNSDDTTLSSSPAWSDGSNVRFRLGRPQVIGGWESLMSSLLTGVCRSVFPWTDNAATLNVGFGTHSALEVWQGGALYNITPTKQFAALALGANPLTTLNTSPNVTFTWNGHPLTTSDTLVVAGSSAVGGITPNGGPFTIVSVTTNTITFAFTSNATSTATGGGSAVIITPQRALAAGAIDGTGSAGYGTGAWGSGPWGETTLGVEFYPRTWSQSAWGQQLLASPRGGGLYLWQNATGTPAAAVANAPWQVAYSLVAPMNGGYQAFALGCNQEADGVFNPMCIRHSSVRDLTTWSTLADGSTAREYVLTGGGRIVAGRMCGPYMLVWTNDALWLGTFVGQLNQPWSFDRVGRNCGLIGPNAAVIVGQSAFWVSPDAQVYTYSLGGSPEPVACPILSDFRENLAASQGDKIVASSNAAFHEIRFDYPDMRDGFENSRYLALCVAGADAGAWHKGIMARTAFVDAGPSQYPIGVMFDGHVYFHEKGQSADGGAFAWFVTSADVYLNAENRCLVRSLWPDFKDQIGSVTPTLTGRSTPQDGNPVTVTGLPMAPGDAKSDLLLDSRLFSISFAGNSAPTACRIGRPVFDAVATGTR